MRNWKKKRERALTMTEILVVIAILGLIAAVGYPSFLRMKSQASSTICAGKLRDIGVAINSYMGEHGLVFPEMEAARESRNEDVPVMDTILKEYLPDEYAFECPADHKGLFEKSGSSYFWNSMINGQRPGSMDLLGLVTSDTGIPIVSDKENFHENVGDEVNILYADGHVYRELKFVVDE